MALFEMTTTNNATGVWKDEGGRVALYGRLRLWLTVARRRRRIIRAYMALTQLDEWLLYDMGVAPLDLHEALKEDGIQRRV
jgi:uncharacterized protein YjiS (DUF1127 family)